MGGMRCVVCVVCVVGVMGVWVCQGQWLPQRHACALNRHTTTDQTATQKQEQEHSATPRPA
jgi:hypothetical protein